MFHTRLLTNDNENDVQQLNLILDNFLESEKNKVQPIYVYEDSVRFITWVKSSFIEKDIKDFVVAGRFFGNEMDQVYVAYKIETTWNRSVVNDVLPYWTLGLMYFKNTTWRSPADQILNLEKLVIDHFENQHYTTGHVLMKAPKGLLKLSDSATIHKYIDNVLKKTLPAYRYDYTIENVFRSQVDIDRYKFSVFKSILPKRILKPAVLISFKLKYEHRSDW